MTHVVRWPELSVTNTVFVTPLDPDDAAISVAARIVYLMHTGFTTRRHGGIADYWGQVTRHVRCHAIHDVARCVADTQLTLNYAPIRHHARRLELTMLCHPETLTTPVHDDEVRRALRDNTTAAVTYATLAVRANRKKNDAA